MYVGAIACTVGIQIAGGDELEGTIYLETMEFRATELSWSEEMVSGEAETQQDSCWTMYDENRRRCEDEKHEDVKILGKEGSDSKTEAAMRTQGSSNLPCSLERARDQGHRKATMRSAGREHSK